MKKKKIFQEALTKIEKILNRNIEFKQKNIKDYLLFKINTFNFNFTITRTFFLKYQSSSYTV
jgi:hypothetical protein